jgi:hypothetical protein
MNWPGMNTKLFEREPGEFNGVIQLPVLTGFDVPSANDPDLKNQMR